MQKYKYRLVVDESLSLGVLGRRGRGAAEHWGFSPEEVEVVGGSMGALGWGAGVWGGGLVPEGHVQAGESSGWGVHVCPRASLLLPW